jgi:hypothetical protein
MDSWFAWSNFILAGRYSEWKSYNSGLAFVSSRNVAVQAETLNEPLSIEAMPACKAMGAKPIFKHQKGLTCKRDMPMLLRIW